MLLPGEVVDIELHEQNYTFIIVGYFISVGEFCKARQRADLLE